MQWCREHQQYYITILHFSPFSINLQILARFRKSEAHKNVQHKLSDLNISTYNVIPVYSKIYLYGSGKINFIYKGYKHVEMSTIESQAPYEIL